MRNKKISDMILKKSSKYLRISVALFLMSLVMLASFLVMMANQYFQVRKDFLKNHNTHMIEVSLHENSKRFDPLDFSDLDKIKSLIEKKYPDQKIQGFNQYTVNFGIESDTGESLFLNSIDDSGIQYLGMDNMNDNCLYCDINTKAEDITLKIPNVDVSSGGWESKNISKLDFTSSASIPEKTPLNLYGKESNTYFVNYNTYKNIICTIFGIDWNNFVENYNDSNPYGVEAVSKVFIYVDNLKYVDKMADVISGAGYAVNYTFKAFDHFDGSMKNTFWIFMILTAFIIIITSINTVMSFNSYLKIQQKDMGILRHYGYDKNAVSKIYAHNVNKIFLIIISAVLAITLIMSFIFIDVNMIPISFPLICAIVLIPLIIVNRYIVYSLVRKYTSQSIIKLLKYSKEFE